VRQCRVVGHFRFQRSEAGAFVRSVAKRLAFEFAARAPKVSAGFNCLDDVEFLGNDFQNAPVKTAFGKNAAPLKFVHCLLRLPDEKGQPVF
jgi:hypothetical protein